MTPARLKKVLTEELEYCESVLREKAHRMNIDYQRIEDMLPNDLPLHVNDEEPYGEMVRERLKGNSIDTPKWHCQALGQVAFDYEDARHIGMNDGALLLIWKLANKLHDKALCERALTAQYSDD